MSQEVLNEVKQKSKKPLIIGIVVGSVLLSLITAFLIFTPQIIQYFYQDSLRDLKIRKDFSCSDGSKVQAVSKERSSGLPSKKYQAHYLIYSFGDKKIELSDIDKAFDIQDSVGGSKNKYNFTYDAGQSAQAEFPRVKALRSSLNYKLTNSKYSN
ncbi:MAG: hypothetical protein WCK98_06225 [bacterium]